MVVLARLITWRSWVRIPPPLLSIVPSSNGRTADFGSACVGSNPAGTTKNEGLFPSPTFVFIFAI